MITREQAERLARAGQPVTIWDDPDDTAVIIRLGADIPGTDVFSVLVERPNEDRSWQPSGVLSAQ